MSDQEFEVLVKLAQIPHHERVADEQRLTALHKGKLGSWLARDVYALLLGSNRNGCLARAWRDLVLRSAGAFR